MNREEAISEWTFRSNHIKEWLDEYGEEPSIRHYVELIDMAIEALSEPSKVDYRTDESANIGTEVNDFISRADAIEAVCKWCDHYESCTNKVDCHQRCVIATLPSADRPQGEWINKDVVQNEDNTIEEWQECQCSVCGKWHTTPYMYYFDDYNYCPNCGAYIGGKK